MPQVSYEGKKGGSGYRVSSNSYSTRNPWSRRIDARGP